MNLAIYSAVTGSIPLQPLADKAASQAQGHDKGHQGIVQQANAASEKADQIQAKIASSPLYTSRGIGGPPLTAPALINERA